MSVSPMQQAFSLMESQRPGWFRETVSLADAGGGIVWCCPNLFLRVFRIRTSPGR